MPQEFPCTDCREIHKRLNKKAITIILEKKLDDVDTCKTELTEAVNALLNRKHGKGGYLLIHANDMGYLDGFDMKLDGVLQKMIPGGTFYDTYFRRHIAPDGQHIVFEVMRQAEEQPLSFLNFHSRVSLNSGTADLTQDQMHAALQMVLKETDTQTITTDLTNNQRDTTRMTSESPVVEETNGDSELSPKPTKKDRFMQNLVKGKEIKYKKVPFVENLAMQAKRAQSGKILQQINNSDFVVGQLWNNKPYHLVHFISAFSKLPCGGSYYFGVNEEKDGKGEKDEKEEKDEKDEKKKKSHKLVRFVCDAVEFEEKQQKEIEEAISYRMNENMLWVGTSKPPNNLVTVKLHPVRIETSSEQQQQQQQHQQQQEQQQKEKTTKQDPPQRQQQQEQTSPPKTDKEQKWHGQQPQPQQQNQNHNQHPKEKMKQDKQQQQLQPQQNQPDQNQLRQQRQQPQEQQQPQLKIAETMKHKQATESIPDAATDEKRGSEHIPAEGRSRYILEIKVGHYANGLLFHNKEGPDIFNVCNESGKPSRISVEDWVKAQDPSGKLRSRIWTHLDTQANQ